MVITRKIEIYVAHSDKDTKKAYTHDMYAWRSLVRDAANVIVSHKYVQQKIRDFIYLKDEIKEKFYVKDIITPAPGNSETNTTYRILSEMLKGKVPSNIYSCLNQSVSSVFKETLKDVLKGESSIRSYKNNIAVPFSANSVRHLAYDAEEGRYRFTLFSVPLACRLGADRSGNAIFLDRIMSGEYKMCNSAYMIDDRKKKIYLLLCVDIPKKDFEPIPEKDLFATLDVETPIVARYVPLHNPSGKAVMENIGNKEEYLYRRLQIQQALRRQQVNNRYTTGGHGRKRKCKKIDDYHLKERRYIEYKCHVYSRMLVDLAVRQKCEHIVLVDQQRKEDEAKEQEFLLRNWSYYGLETKIKYKASQYGIQVIKQ